MKRDRDNLRRIIRETGFAEYEDYLLQHARPSIRVYTHRVRSETQLAIGQSKIGGRPDLPRDMEWLKAADWKGNPQSMPFIAQIDLRDVKQFDEENLLPDSGILYFFSIWHREARVIFYTGAKSLLERRSYPSDLPPTPRYEWGKHRFNPCRLKFVPEVNLPNEDADWSPPDYPDERWEEFYELIQRASYASFEADEDDNVNRLLGYNFGVPVDMQLEAEFIASGRSPYSTADYYNSEELRKSIDPLRRNWQLLFQVGSDQNANMAWSDMGTICFYIRRDDLKNRHFDNVVLTFFTA